jgi:hypothetical protein
MGIKTFVIRKVSLDGIIETVGGDAIDGTGD